jgi:glyoxylase-like metal-dependent hydrolase (beta-lactamase superfamily II)
MALKVYVQPVTAFQQNCSILHCESTGEIALVDPGGDLDLILNKTQTLQGEIKYILLTHGHLDHAGEAKPLAEQLNLQIYGPQFEDQFWLDKMEEQSQMFGFQTTASYRPNRYFEDQEEIQLGDSCLKVIHCPGHTPGHIVFYLEQEKVLIAGDVLFKGSIGRTDFPKSNHQDLVDSIRNKLFPLGDDITVYPGHGPTTTIGEEKLHNPYVSGI